MMDWNETKPKLLATVDKLRLLPLVVTDLVVQYCASLFIDSTSRDCFTLPEIGRPQALTFDGKQVIISDSQNYRLLYSGFDGIFAPLPPQLDANTQVCCTAFEFSRGLLYISSHNHLRVIRYDTQEVVWDLKIHGRPDGLCVDEDLVYLTLPFKHQISVFQYKATEPCRKLGNRGSFLGEFKMPRGLVTNKNLIYICDCSNHRVQALEKEDGKFSHAWGGGHWTSTSAVESPDCFKYPWSITIYEDLVYVGDSYQIQLYPLRGDHCLQKINGKIKGEGGLDVVSGLLIVERRLFVCDSNNLRIVVFDFQK